MKTTKWSDVKHKAPADVRAKNDAAARAELNSKGLAALRKAREMTQVELAEQMGMPQAGISQLENRSDNLLSTLAKYIRATGGELELRVVYPDAVFHLDMETTIEDVKPDKPRKRTRAAA